MLSVTASDSDELIAPHPLTRSAAKIIEAVGVDFLNIVTVITRLTAAPFSR
jgi:hypothetical protein